MLIHKETAHTYEINSSVYFIALNDFKERIVNAHLSGGTMADLIEESLLKMKFLDVRKGQNKLLDRMQDERFIDFKKKIPTSSTFKQNQPATQKNSNLSAGIIETSRAGFVPSKLPLSLKSNVMMSTRQSLKLGRLSDK